jgi:hypothetical protein
MLAQVRLEQRLEKPPVVRDFQVQKLVDDDLVAEVGGERMKLLYGPYKAPRLRRGDRGFCLFRDCDVIVTGWTDARISWPNSTSTPSGSYVNFLIKEDRQ